MWSHPMSAFTSTPSERTHYGCEHSSKWRYLVAGWVSQLGPRVGRIWPRGGGWGRDRKYSF
eukprot:scaffold3513_cov127-Isochrysis_galbana.AAC.6